ncbi:hypothetical protein [Maridesulfovibrio sp.]|uniref:hypothetical protein n=1 Tax=Maridesulfovibrio sp. TaxID=2795000 RepID=UPI003BAA733D
MTFFTQRIMKLTILVCCALTLAVLFSPQSAHAGYLDPGSGSTAVQWIIAGVAAISRIKRQIIDAFSNFFSR